MKKLYITATLILLIVILGAAGLSACAAVASAQQMGSMEAQVNTAVAATLIQQAVETKVAAQSVAMAQEPAEPAQATQAPTATPLPTRPPLPTAAPTEAAQLTVETSFTSATGPTILADQNTNCRTGPGTRYTVVAYFMKGSESTVEGRDSTKDWWYIVNPEDESKTCWVWEGSTTVVGDASTLPVVAAPASASYTTGYWYDDCYYVKGYGCVYYPYNPCWNVGYWCGCYTCGQKKPACNANSWWSCNPYGYCTCKPVFKDPWEKSSCPPLTAVNYKNYCKNYPQCCDD